MTHAAALYTRVSTAGQVEKHSLPAQEAALRDYAGTHGLTAHGL
jgi:DNA invertase Pin-like site-specific DNA recombinase